MPFYTYERHMISMAVRHKLNMTDAVPVLINFYMKSKKSASLSFFSETSAFLFLVQPWQLVTKKDAAINLQTPLMNQH